MSAPLYSDGFFLIWRLPGERWRLHRAGEQLEQKWVSVTEMAAYDLTDEEHAEAKYLEFAPPEGDPWR